MLVCISVVLVLVGWVFSQIQTTIQKERLQELPVILVQIILPLFVMEDGLLPTFDHHHFLAFQ